MLHNLIAANSDNGNPSTNACVRCSLTGSTGTSFLRALFPYLLLGAIWIWKNIYLCCISVCNICLRLHTIVFIAILKSLKITAMTSFTCIYHNKCITIICFITELFLSINHAHTNGWAQIMLVFRKNVRLTYNKITQNYFQLLFQRTLFGHYSNGVFEGVETKTPFE